MAQINPPRTLTQSQSRHHELREDALATGASRGTEFYDDHKTTIIAVIVGVFVLALAIIGWRTWQANKSAEGQRLLGAILTEYEAGNYQIALEGTESAPGLLQIADEYGSTATGEQATFFAADALYQTGDLDRALAMFEDYDGDDIMAASALAGQAAIYEDRGDHARAAGLYIDAADEYDSPASTPGYLLDAARAFAAAGDTGEATEALERVVNDWDTTPEYRTALVELGQVQAAAAAVGEATGDVTAAPIDTSAVLQTDQNIQEMIDSGRLRIGNDGSAEVVGQ
ncbi:tetratricopeptide repeat protein [Rubrivirga sp. IMCC43871]|uniref:tetratricopeptide repeat protein n=1 Tax=Rubrivirga sp. IMCC43871 TaxID=3391575 RepID=UPI00398F9F2D